MGPLSCWCTSIIVCGGENKKQLCVSCSERLTRANWLLDSKVSTKLIFFIIAIVWPPSRAMFAWSYEERPPPEIRNNCSDLVSWHSVCRLEEYFQTPPVSPPSQRSVTNKDKTSPIFLCIWPIRNMVDSSLEKKKSVLSCGLSRFNLCMPFVYSDCSCQTLTYTCTESYGCHVAGHGTGWNRLTARAAGTITVFLIWYNKAKGLMITCIQRHIKEVCVLQNKHLFTRDDCTFTHIYPHRRCVNCR